MSNLEIKDMVALSVLFIAAFWLWTLPLQESPLPFGEHDGAYIFSYGDRMSYVDRSSSIVGDSPISIISWYSGWNPVLGPTALEYPPPYLMGYAFAQIFGGERIVPAYIYVAITSFAAVFSMYLLMRKLYGFEAALIASTGVLFSYRAILTYLWGQRHNLTSFVFIPIAIYALYKYLDSFYKDKENIAYLYIFVLLLLCTYLIHLGGTVFILPYSLIFVALMALKYKRVPLSKQSFKHYLILVVLIIIVAAPFYLIYFGPDSTSDADFKVKELGSLFYWVKVPEGGFGGLNPIYHDYKATYIGKWTLILVFAGVIAMLIKRRNQDLVILSALIGLYVMFHLPTIGWAAFSSPRIARILVLESYFFYAVMAIALVSIPSFLPIKKIWKKYLKTGLAILFLSVLLATAGVQSYKALKGAYPPILRITPVQYELTEWIQENTPHYSAFNILGTLTYPKWRFIQILSRRVMLSYDDVNRRERVLPELLREDTVIPEPFRRGNDMVIPIDYTIFDYSDLILIGDRGKVEALNNLEKNISANASLVYDQNNIRVYKLG